MNVVEKWSILVIFFLPVEDLGKSVYSDSLYLQTYFQKTVSKKSYPTKIGTQSFFAFNYLVKK